MMGFHHQDYPSKKKIELPGNKVFANLVLQVALYFPQESCIHMKYSEAMPTLDNL